MNPSEQALEVAINTLKASPGTFQSLVDHYARTKYPIDLEGLSPVGRTAAHAPVKGWPDSYSEHSDGRLSVVEATLESTTAGWRRHLDHDISRAAAFGTGRIRSILFVAYASRPARDVIEFYRDRLGELGIPREKIHLTFKQDLLFELTQPRYARIWTEVLGLRASCYPFHSVQDALRLFGRPGDVRLFAPTKDEYRSGDVYWPQVGHAIEDALKSEHWAFLQGRGAAGKTVLATQIAFGPAFEGAPTYYLDVADCGVEGRGESTVSVLDVLVTRADQGVLFILDNVHLNPELSRTIFDHWRAFSSGSKLLLVGRLTSRGPDPRGLADPLEPLKDRAHFLAVGKDELLGVLRRLLGRSGKHLAPEIIPTLDVVTRWERLFGGDLIAFSAAVARRISELRQGLYDLQASDAVEWVRHAYVRSVSDQERSALIRLSVLGALEIGAPTSIVAPGSLGYSLSIGLAHRVDSGRSLSDRVHLVHPGMADLLLAAIEPEVSQMGIILEIVRGEPSLGLAIATALERRQATEQATEVLRELARSTALLESLLEGGLDCIVPTVRLLDRFAVLTAQQSDLRLASEATLAFSAFLEQGLPAIAELLTSAVHVVPLLRDEVAKLLDDTANESALVSSALRLSLGQLYRVLRSLKARHRPLSKRILEQLADQRNKTALSAAIFNSHVGELTTFLSDPTFVSDPEGRDLPFHRAILEEVLNPSNRAAMETAIFTAPLDALVSLLTYAKMSVPRMHSMMISLLSDGTKREALKDLVCRSRLNAIASFIRHCEGASERLHRWTQSLFLDEATLVLFANTACRASPYGLLGFVKDVAASGKVLARIDIELWRKTLASKALERAAPGLMAALALEIARRGRPDLAEAIARALVMWADG
ncbi:MAG TPA: hypothetical protein VI837_05315, partial [Blastocatellia bacterium]|nr:hypothetical protein [Blastocatellia bacterium]